MARVWPTEALARMRPMGRVMEGVRGEGTARRAAKSRRRCRDRPTNVLGISFAVVALVIGAGAGIAPAADRDLARLVDVFTGTDAVGADFGTGGGAGNTFPGAVVPFGMVQWSPDTTPSATNYGGGYSYGETRIRGFSLTHLSGVGCPIFQDVPFLPTMVPVDVSPAVVNRYDVEPRYLPSFTHDDERAEPGYYRVRLDPETTRAIDVEITATTRTGHARLTCAPTATASVLINAGGSAMANREAVFAIDPARREVSGWVESGQFCYHRNRYRLYFAAEFSRPFAAHGTWTRQALVPGATASADHAADPFHLRPISGFPSPSSASTGAQAGAYVTFDARRDRVVEIRVGISYVSVENARANLQAENPTWRFDRVRAQARRTWNAALGRIRVAGGERDARRTFYTMLYHALLGPTVFSDVTGEYRGMDGAVHTATDFVQYANVSGWDIYRSQFPLLAMLDPVRASHVVRSLLTNAAESGWLPKWPVANGQTNVMVGDPAAAMIASAHAFGARDFDAPAALAVMRAGASEVGMSPNAAYVERAAVSAYRATGYVPHDGTEGSTGASTSIFGDSAAVWGSVATTLEYATADFAIARLAAALGDDTTCGEFLTRAGGWTEIFNPATGYVQPRRADGTFVEPFDPTSLDGFAEGNATQYTWMVPHDLAGLAAALGGRDAAAARLDAFFGEINAGPDAPFAFLGNEPNAIAPWIFDWLGQPHRTQALVRQAVRELFSTDPAGYPGNDDMGQMSAWYVFGALGFYPAIPGTDVLALASPLFEKTRIALPGGALRMRAPRAGPATPYVRRLTIDGVPHRAPWIRFRDVRDGAEMAWDLSASPDPSWGAAPSDAPPSFPSDDLSACGMR